ncbi:hypothetical protein EPO33_03200 [Patescibacteria group bacterium]|nr:MAG: hypothetical protein EPO33_03200 [Patescibacteria group bacterium]
MPAKKRKQAKKKNSAKKQAVRKVAIPKALLAALDKRNLPFEVVSHRKVYTAYDLAQTMGEDLNRIAKTLLLSVDLPQMKIKGQKVVLVIPASYRADFGMVKKKMKAARVSLAPEKLIAKLGIEPGTQPPFAAVYGGAMVLVDKGLLTTRDAIFRAGSLTDSLRMKVKDFVKAEGATVGKFGTKSGVKLQTHPKKKKKPAKKRPAKKVAKKKRA